MGQAAGIIEPAEYQCVTVGVRTAVSSRQVNARKHLWEFESVLFRGVTRAGANDTLDGPPWRLPWLKSRQLTACTTHDDPSPGPCARSGHPLHEDAR